MLQKLEPDKYERTRKLFAPVSYHLAIESIIKGLSRAKILVDNATSPKSAFTWLKGRAWVVGKSDNDFFNKALSELIVEEYCKELTAYGAKTFRLHYSPANWESKMNLIFEDMPKTKGLRQYYHLDATKRTWETTVPSGFTILFIDADLLANTQLKNLNYVIEEIQSERLSVEDFLKKSFGHCVVYNNEIVGWCMSEYNMGYRCELGIETVQRFQRRGIATLSVTAVIKHALVQGITDIGWHCWADNKPSIATAEKLGFTKECEYNTYTVLTDRTE